MLNYWASVTKLMTQSVEKLRYCLRTVSAANEWQKIRRRTNSSPVASLLKQCIMSIRLGKVYLNIEKIPTFLQYNGTTFIESRTKIQNGLITV